MLKRKPHTDLAIITGNQSAQNYLEMQKKMARFYLNGFLRIVEDQKRTESSLKSDQGPAIKQ